MRVLLEEMWYLQVFQQSSYCMCDHVCSLPLLYPVYVRKNKPFVGYNGSVHYIVRIHMYVRIK